MWQGGISGSWVKLLPDDVLAVVGVCKVLVVAAVPFEMRELEVVSSVEMPVVRTEVVKLPPGVNPEVGVGPEVLLLGVILVVVVATMLLLAVELVKPGLVVEMVGVVDCGLRVSSVTVTVGDDGTTVETTGLPVELMGVLFSMVDVWSVSVADVWLVGELDVKMPSVVTVGLV